MSLSTAALSGGIAIACFVFFFIQFNGNGNVLHKDGGEGRS